MNVFVKISQQVTCKTCWFSSLYAGYLLGFWDHKNYKISIYNWFSVDEFNDCFVRRYQKYCFTLRLIFSENAYNWKKLYINKLFWRISMINWLLWKTNLTDGYTVSYWVSCCVCRIVPSPACANVICRQLWNSK